MHYARFEGIIFLEGDVPESRKIEPVDVRVGGVFTSGQLRTLDDVKRIMARSARERRGNAVVDFAYGQKSVGFFASLLNRDDVVWYGRGTIAILNPARFP